MLALIAFTVFRILGESAADDWPTFDDIQNSVYCCPDVPKLRSFNMSRFAGDWQIWRNGSKEDSTRNCEVEKFKVDNEILMSSEISFYTGPNCNKYVVEKTFYEQSVSVNSSLFMSKKDMYDPSTDGDFQIVDTDYDSYAVVYRDCWIVNDEWYSSSVAAILVRHHEDKPIDLLSEYSVGALVSHGLYPDQFKKNHCHPCSFH